MSWRGEASPMGWARERRAMREKTERTVVAGIGDLHLAETAVHPFRDLFAEISEEADVLALCGDLTNLGLPREAEILAEDLRSYTIPVVGVLGNHDFESGQAEEVARVLRQAGVCFLRSEEHTSELQSLMRISYAVFCLKKKQ